MDENTLPTEVVTETDLWLLANLNLIGEPLTMEWTDDVRKLIRLGLIYKASQGVDTTLKVAITPAGRALLPAGEAVVVLADVDENPMLMLGRKVQELQAELAAALARAQAAEGEVQRLMQKMETINSDASVALNAGSSSLLGPALEHIISIVKRT